MQFPICLIHQEWMRQTTTAKINKRRPILQIATSIITIIQLIIGGEHQSNACVGVLGIIPGPTKCAVVCYVSISFADPRTMHMTYAYQETPGNSLALRRVLPPASSSPPTITHTRCLRGVNRNRSFNLSEPTAKDFVH
jgi:hypothetical protein